MGEKKSKKRKIRFKGLLVILLFIYLIGTCLYYLWSMPIRKVEIKGNSYLKDNYIINYLDIDDESIIKLSKKDIETKLLKLDLISNVKVKKNYFGTLYIELFEDKVLFYNWNNKKIILSSGKEISYNKEYLGVPTLINYVPEDVYKEFIAKFNAIDKDNISLISEIEYSPSMVNDKVIDDKRFLFRMNDGNIVYINTINIEKFNNYLDIYEVIVNKNGLVKGCLYLDSNSENNHFNNCESSPVVEEEVNNNGEN